jgi:hypothetical protein
MTREPISTADFINVSHQSVCLYMYVITHWIGKNVTAATDKQATIEQLLEVLFSMGTASYQRIVDD